MDNITIELTREDAKTIWKYLSFIDENQEDLVGEEITKDESHCITVVCNELWEKATKK